jgi:hypothetical protein
MSDYARIDNPYSPQELEALADCWKTLAEDFWKDDVFRD